MTREPRPRIAFVVQRYGPEVVGGAELHGREFAERLLPWFDVEVLTTCALDYRIWANHFPRGESVVNGVRVRRFASARERHPALDRWWGRWSRRPRTARDEMTWLLEVALAGYESSSGVTGTATSSPFRAAET